MEDLVELIRGAQAGDEQARHALFATLYDELKKLAHARLRGGGRDSVLDTTSLVHDAYLRYAKAGVLRADDRRGFFAYMSRVMRSVIVDAVRERKAGRNNDGLPAVTLDTQIQDELPDGAGEVLDVHEALETLEKAEPRLAQVVEMRYFGGYKETEIAEILGLTERTVRRDWARARLLLIAAMKG